MTSYFRFSALSLFTALFAYGCSVGASNANLTPDSSLGRAASSTRQNMTNSGDLYVASAYTNAVTVYQPGGTSPVQTILGTAKHPLAPAALVIHKNNLYVANAATGINSVSVYALGAAKPKYTITNGVAQPLALAVDSKNRLYVMNAGNGTITVYAAGRKTPHYAVANGVNGPQALALDSYDDLFVANYSGNTVMNIHRGLTR